MIAERFLNASLFFAEKTEKLDTIKLYKLLFLADRECMKRTGHTITESVYRKIKPWGPVPLEAKALVDGIAAGDEDRPSISRFLEVQKQGRNTHISFHGVANLDYFSGEEVRILEKLAAGESVEAILAAHPRLTREAVSAALAFAAESMKAEVAHPLKQAV